MNENAIEIINLSKGFKLPHEKQTTIKGLIINFRKRGFERQQVLTDLSFTVKKGEFLGILGRNGSGKSTFLKTVSGIYSPDKGEIRVNGKLTPFIELGVGFNPELSGKDNVYLNGALLGFSRKEVDKLYDDIVAFAELERFMDQKLKNYSSGMQVRLAFSIAIQANTDILILDEVLAVGDEAFQRKCYNYFNELKLKGKTVVLVTHDMSAVQRFCTRAIVLNAGKVIFDGDTEGATDIYRNLNLDSTEAALIKKNKHKNEHAHSMIRSIQVRGDNGSEKAVFRPHEHIVISASIKLDPSNTNPGIELWFNNPGGTALANLWVHSTDLAKRGIDTSKEFTIDWIMDGIYNDGKYYITIQISNEDTGSIVKSLREAAEFDVVGWDSPTVLVHPKPVFNVSQ